MSDMSKYQRSKQQVLDMIGQLKQRLRLALRKKKLREVKDLTQNINELNKTVQIIDYRLAKLEEAA